MQLPDGVKITPMLEQYIHWKDKYPDCLLFFRMGDFYEMFFDDAYTAASVLDIVLTSRSKDENAKIPMAGVPFHSVDSYIGRLIAAGFKVAICEQMTEPDGRTLVEREVTRIVTPGTWLPENSEGDGKIAACLFCGKEISIALLDTPVGTLRAATFAVERGVAVVTAFSPNEIIIKRGQREDFIKNCPLLASRSITERDKSEFMPQQASGWLCRKWNIASLSAMGIDDRDNACGVAAAALRYIEETQFSKASHITSVMPIFAHENMVLDQSTQTNLELTGQKENSLFWALNRCRTPMGKRLLKEWITEPLQDIDAIKKRQDIIECLIENPDVQASLAELLSETRDMGKAISRITLKMGSPCDLSAIRDTLQRVPKIMEVLHGEAVLAELVPHVNTDKLSTLLCAALSDTVPRLLRDGGVIRCGYDSTLDEWRSKIENSSQWLADFEEKERTRTGIKNLKARMNRVFGYYIEIPKAAAAHAPIEYIRKQTLAGAERFITEELKKFERVMFGAEDEIRARELEIYNVLIKETLAMSHEIQETASFIASLDTFLSLSVVAAERGYCRPVVDLGKDFVIKNARHPVIELTLGKNPFTPNDYDFSAENGRRIALITGPNMAGKSTYLRMAALIAIMAHIGSFIPAESAKIGLVDRVFTRIGARDELSRGQSTFMVEMVETANILRSATDRSLVILDEVGRGTSTYDGLSIAWSVVEFLQGQEYMRPRVLFATHYHELTQLARVLPGIVNLSMGVEETDNGIIFLHKIIEAPSDRSYGIEVARLAGIPLCVLRRSEELLAKFEAENESKNEDIMSDQSTQIALFDVRQEAILEELASCDPDNMTPLSALELVSRLRTASRKVLELE
ncbi:MAG: DNA mismatch repair protein MutS [Synergistes sp.]|nr:DNA mismatch repair protein MutS [Synergistes sp.]